MTLPPIRISSLLPRINRRGDLDQWRVGPSHTGGAALTAGDQWSGICYGASLSRELVDS
jgi:hypothetical protein